MKRLLIVSTLALTAWSYPIHAASALTETKYGDETIFINYQAHRTPVPSEPAKTSQRKVAGQIQSQTQGYQGKSYSKEEVIQLIHDYSLQYHIDPTTPLCIAKLESGYNQFSANKSSSARGVFQYLSGTWKGTDEGKAGLSVFDANANVKAAIKYMAIHKSTQPWTTRTKCPPLVFL